MPFVLCFSHEAGVIISWFTSGSPYLHGSFFFFFLVSEPRPDYSWRALRGYYFYFPWRHRLCRYRVPATTSSVYSADHFALVFARAFLPFWVLVYNISYSDGWFGVYTFRLEVLWLDSVLIRSLLVPFVCAYPLLCTNGFRHVSLRGACFLARLPIRLT